MEGSFQHADASFNTPDKYSEKYKGMFGIVRRLANKNPPIMRITYRGRAKRGGHVRADFSHKLSSSQATDPQDG